MQKKLISLLPRLVLGAVCVLSAAGISNSYAADGRNCGEVLARCNAVLAQIQQNAIPQAGTRMSWLCGDFQGDGNNGSYRGDCEGKWGRGDPNKLTNPNICNQMAAFPGGVYVKWCKDRQAQL